MMYKWWHKFVRKRTRPIPGDQATLWKRRLSIAYGLFAWNAFGLVLYNVYQGKADWAHYHGLKTDEEYNMSPARSWANTLGVKNAKVYRISGFKKIDEYDIVDGEEVRQVKQSTQENPNEFVEE